MSNDRLESLFQKVLALDSLQREKLLVEMPNEDRLRIEKLLQADSSDIELVENPHSKNSSSKVASATAHPTLERIRDYELRGVIGEGGMGTVYRAFHSRLQRSVAVKILPQFQQRHRAETIARFDREMAVVGRLQHPNIVQASDAGEEGGVHYLVLELVEGADLGRISKAVGSMSIADAAEIVRQAGLGLQHAHDHGLVHRDIKPANLLVSNTGVVKIADMGLALLHDHGELTTTGQVMGTMDYIAPEQIASAHDVDGRADLYSLGCTLYKLLTGKAPFDTPETDGLLQKIQAHTNSDSVPIQKLREDVPKEVAQILKRLLAKDPQERFGSAKELVDAITPFSNGAQITRLVEQASGGTKADQGTVQFFTDPVETEVSEPDVTQWTEPPRTVPSGVSPRIEPSTAPVKQPAGRRVIIALLLCALGFAAVFNAPQIIRIVTNKGVLVINNHEGVDVQITQGTDDPVLVHDKVGDRKYTLDVGDDYRLLIKDPESGTEYESEAFSIKRNGKIIFDARAEIAKATPERSSVSKPPAELKIDAKVDSKNSSGQTPIQICQQLFSRGLVTRISGYDQGKSFSARTIDQLPQVLKQPSKVTIAFTLESSDSTCLEEGVPLAVQLDLAGIYIYGTFPPTVAALESLAAEKRVLYISVLSKFSVPNLAALPEGAFAYPIHLSLHNPVSDKDLQVVLKRFAKLKILSVPHPDIEGSFEMQAAYPENYLTLAAADELAEPTTLTFERIKNVRKLKVLFPNENDSEPQADYRRLPLEFEDLLVYNAQLNASQFSQLKQYQRLKQVEQKFTTLCKRIVAPLDPEIPADFQQSRPDVTLRLSLPGN